MTDVRQLCVGVVIAAGRPPAWACRAVDALAAERGVQVTTILRPDPVRRWPTLAPRALVERAGRHRSAALSAVEPPPVLDPLPPTPPADLLDGALCGEAGSTVGHVRRPVDGGPVAAALGAAEPTLDVVVDLAGTEGPTERLSGLTRLGLWRFEFGPERVGAAGPVGLADVLAGRPTADIRLLAHTANGRTSVLREGTLRTIAHSWGRHRDHLLLHGVDWPALACRDALAGRAASRAVPPAAGPPPRGGLARLAWRTLVGRAARAVRFLQEAQWHVGVVDAPIDAFLRPGHLPPPTWLPGPPRHAFYADPFPCAGGRRVIVERFGLHQRVGTLCSLDLASPGAPPQPIATPSHHISYPFVLEHAGQTYCTPETADLGEVGLYRLVGEPFRLEKVTTLVDGIAAVDPTVTLYNGRWWLFFTDRDRSIDTDLHVWHAPDLLGPWRAHGRNPVKVDVRSSRPAGTPFTCDGTLFRPAMDNSGSYGGQLIINRVVEITPDDFEEEVTAVIPPFPGPFRRGIHTVAAAGRATIVDGKRLRVVPSALPAKLRAHRDRRPAG